jgi:hypothetical protein
MTSTTVITFTSIGFVALALLLLFVVRADAGRVTTISCQQLAERSLKWQEPKVALWSYQGTTKGYHYFYFNDLPKGQRYRVLEKEMNVVASFPFTTDRNKWRVLPWGPPRYAADKKDIPQCL